MKFRVWAPEATSVELLLAETTCAMTQDSSGWWEAAPPVTGPGHRYQFRINGGPPLPDPRSPWQPEGVHGPSVTWDHAAYQWNDTGWNARPLSEAVLYELHIGTFTPEGTYAAASQKLPHLRALGITHIELMPLAAFPGERGWGYDGVSLYAPHPAYGTPDELKALVDAAHGHGIAVLLDVVYNHLGPDGNYLGACAPYFTDHVRTPWGEAVNFSGPFSDEVRAFFIDNALMWLRDYHFDGLRLDAVHAIFDETAIHFLEELAGRVEELGATCNRRLVLIAESDLNNPRLVHSHHLGGYGLDAHWIDDFHHALHAYFTGDRTGYYADYGSLADVAKALRQAYVFDGQYSNFRKRHHGRPPIDVRPSQLIVYSQNHDQTGNRALGDRTSHLAGPASLKAIAALTLLSPFVPMLFQGEEWAASTPFLYFTDHVDKALGRRITQGRLREFAGFDWPASGPPDPQDRRTFERSKLSWPELTDPAHAGILAWHAALLALRRDQLLPSANRAAPDVRVHFDEPAGWLTLQRGNLLVLCNFSTEPRRIPHPSGAWNVQLCSSGITPPKMIPIPPKTTRIAIRS